MLPKIVAIVGPTCSGKTALGEHLARLFDGEIVTADSPQVYRGMDIGTAKVEERARCTKTTIVVFVHQVCHWLVDMVDPDEPFTVQDWKAAAKKVIAEILARNHLPIVVGGTGLYIQAIVDNLEPPAIAPDPTLRASLEAKPFSELVALLKEFDPEAEEHLDLKNPRRVIRALEISIQSGQPHFKLKKRGAPLYETLQIAIDVPRKELYARIDARVDAQVKEGLFEEVEKLLEKYPPDLPAFSAIGYREVFSYFQKKYSKAEAIERIKYDTHAYARKQLIWFRRDKRIRWVKSFEEAERLVRTFPEERH